MPIFSRWCLFPLRDEEIPVFLPNLLVNEEEGILLVLFYQRRCPVVIRKDR